MLWYLLRFAIIFPRKTIAFPNLLLSMASGAIWGPYLGTVYTVVGAIVGSILPFLIAKK